MLSIQDDKYPLDQSLPDDQLQKQEENALIQLLLDYTVAKPVVYMLDDWQFSDALSYATLKRLVGVLSQANILIVVNFRPLYQENWGIVDHHVSLLLKTLTPSETKDLVLNYLKVKNAPKGLIKLIYEKTGVNPYYIEEMCYALLEQGSLVTDGDDAVLSVAMDEIALPDTMQGILTTRIGRLPEHTRDMINHAAVIGVTFSYQILAGIMDDTTFLDQAIGEAKAADLIEEIQLTPELVYSFKIAMTQTIVHENLLKKTNAMIHEKVGTVASQSDT